MSPFDSEQLRHDLSALAVAAAEMMEEGGGSEHRARSLRKMAADPDISKMELHSLLRTASELEHDASLAGALDDIRKRVDRLEHT